MDAPIGNAILTIIEGCSDGGKKIFGIVVDKMSAKRKIVAIIIIENALYFSEEVSSALKVLQSGLLYVNLALFRGLRKK